LNQGAGGVADHRMFNTATSSQIPRTATSSLEMQKPPLTMDINSKMPQQMLISQQQRGYTNTQSGNRQGAKTLLSKNYQRNLPQLNANRLFGQEYGSNGIKTGGQKHIKNVGFTS